MTTMKDCATDRKAEYVCHRHGNEKWIAETARVDQQKSDRVIAEIWSPSI
jgi:hypothetical protein